VLSELTRGTPSGEASFIKDFSLDAIRMTERHRIRFHAMTRPDITEYLPPAALTPALAPERTWLELHREHERTGTTSNFKTWMGKKYGADYSSNTLERAAASLDSLHPDFTTLLASCAQRTGGRTSAERPNLAQRLGEEGARALAAGVRANHAVRHRYAEDELAPAMRRGVGQYVVLGAGFDSFAYRHPGLAPTLRVFEVDLPGAQQTKRARLAQMGVTEPANLSFVPVDFERQSLLAALETAGYRARELGFVAWLGVTQYLTAEATGRTLEELASLARGSEIVFEYIVPEEALGGTSGCGSPS
jgi:methyltransferase (TIGR00027 family)